jgi:kynurenine formamidase
VQQAVADRREKARFEGEAMTQDEATITPEYSLAKIREMCTKYRNWGRWGADDEVGTFNLVTPDKVAAAAQLVRRGTVFSLSLPFDAEGPMTGALGRTNPAHIMLQDGGDIASGAQSGMAPLGYTDDAVYMILQCATQWDALSHVFMDDKMYNGYGTDSVNSAGAQKNSITAMKDKVVTRGVLLDIARYKGKQWLDISEPITHQDLAGCAQSQRVEIGAGDVVLVRSGRLAFIRERGSWGDEYAGGNAPGLGVTAADFFCPLDVAAVATDTSWFEVQPNETLPEMWQPLHAIMTAHAGITIGEMFDLESLAEDCARDGVYEFMFVAPPLNISKAVGSPINPQAIK